MPSTAAGTRHTQAVGRVDGEDNRRIQCCSPRNAASEASRGTSGGAVGVRSLEKLGEAVAAELQVRSRQCTRRRIVTKQNAENGHTRSSRNTEKQP